MIESNLKSVYDWIEALLQAAMTGDAASLRECMIVGQDEGVVRMYDDSGCERRYGDALFEETSVMALRQLVDGDVVGPVFERDAERAAWATWMAGVPDNSANRSAILDIPLIYIARPTSDREECKSSAQRAGEHLLRLLKAEASVRFVRFYDGTDETHDRLHKEFGLDGDESPAVLMDAVVWQLKQKRLVETTEMPEELSDSQHDYQIALTADGRAYVESGKEFMFQYVQLL